jgi:hypothetical protein
MYKALVENPEGKRPLGRPTCRWENNIKIDLKEIGWESVDWNNVAQDMDWWWTLMNVVMNFQVQTMPGIS